MKRIAVYGGAFDPPHSGHALVIKEVLKSGLVDELWLVPTGDSRYDKQSTASGAQRGEMLMLFLSDLFPNEQRIRLDTVQIDGLLPDCTTYDLLTYYRRQHGEAEFFLVLGAENIARLPTWRHSEKLLKEAKFIFVPRLNEPVSATPPGAHLLEVPVQSDASSSAVKMKLVRGETVENLISPQVLNMIKTAGLYQKPRAG